MLQISSTQLDIWVAMFVWPFIRILAMLATAPVFDHKTIQRRLRVGLAAMITFLVAPLLPTPPTLSDSLALGVLLQQILIGVAMGFSMRLIFTAFEMAGEILGLQMGLAFAQVVDPQRGSQTPLIGSFLSILASLIFLCLDGHLLVITAVIKSFDLIPISSSLDVISTQKIATAGNIMFGLALQMSLPVLTAVLISNVVMGILARAAPQLNVMSIGFSITITIGLWVLWVSLPYFVADFENAVNRILEVSILKEP